jgi:thiol-disulfide isomerase/thioredoxin
MIASLPSQKGFTLKIAVPLPCSPRIAVFVVAAVLSAVAAEHQLGYAAPPSPEVALGLQPVQSDVDFQKPGPDEVPKCRVVDVKEEGWSGWAVETADGVKLRRFADTDGDKKVDLWCYYDHGIEVYRDIDADHNGKADQYRWLGTAGTRWGLDDNEDGKIDRWRQISAEEVTAEVVAAIAKKDTARFNRLLATPDDLKTIGVGEAMNKRLLSKIESAKEGFEKLVKSQSSISSSARWVQFASPSPGVVPQGVEGSTRDIKVYENAVAMYDDDKQGGQVFVGTLIQVGDAWRIVDVPQIVDPDQPLTHTAGVFFSTGGAANMSLARNAMSSQTQELHGSLEAIDRELASASKPAQVAELNRRRVDVVEKLIKAAPNANDRDSWMRQLVDTVSVAVQSGNYPDGLERLKKFSGELGAEDRALQSYADFQIISGEYIKRQTPDADFAKVQEWYLEELTKFVSRYPDTPESAQAMLQLALSKEFEEKKDAAAELYARVAKAFSGTDSGEKAAGAVRRLQSEGRSIEFRGRTINGEPFDLAKAAGRPVIIHYWATWCDACKQDMKLLRQLQAKYQSTGLTVVGVNVDATREDAAAYLKANPAPWIHLFEDGGLESSGLAKQLGVQTLPMMLLIDPSGKVISNNIYAASLDAELTKVAKVAAKPTTKK